MLQGIWNKTAATHLSLLIQGLNPEETIIHIHGWIKALSSSIGKVLNESPFSTICTLHDYFLACPNGGFYNYQQKRICHLQPMGIACICSNCDVRSYSHKLWRVVRQGVQIHAGKIPSGIEHFIAVTGFSEKILRPFFPPQAKIHALSSPAYYPYEQPIRTNTDSDRLLCVGRLSPEKGIELACESARRSNAKLTIIGDGELRNKLKDQFPEVEFKGWLDPTQVFAEMLNARGLIFPSLLYETQGLAVLEALSVGLPVIVSEDCAASEFVDGKNGLLFKTNDTDDLTARIKMIYDAPAMAQEMSRYAFEKYWQDPYTLPRYTTRLIEIYNEMLNTKAKKDAEEKTT